MSTYPIGIILNKWKGLRRSYQNVITATKTCLFSLFNFLSRFETLKRDLGVEGFKRGETGRSSLYVVPKVRGKAGEIWGYVSNSWRKGKQNCTNRVNGTLKNIVIFIVIYAKFYTNLKGTCLDLCFFYQMQWKLNG